MIEVGVGDLYWLLFCVAGLCSIATALLIYLGWWMKSRREKSYSAGFSSGWDEADATYLQRNNINFRIQEAEAALVWAEALESKARTDKLRAETEDLLRRTPNKPAQEAPNKPPALKRETLKK